MPSLEAFASRFADFEQRDRQVFVMRHHPTLGSAACALLEFYCSESECDCRLAVLALSPPEADAQCQELFPKRS